MAVITISRQFGAGGRTLCQMIAKKLDYRFLDDLIIQEILKKVRVSEDSVKSIERSAGGMLERFLSGMLSRSYMERITGNDKGYIDEVIYVDVLFEIITEFAKQNNVVIMGRGGQYVLSDFKGAYHILLVATKEDRIKFMRRYYNMSTEKAKQAVSQGEKRRANLYRKFGKENYNQPHLYHLVLNMSRCTLEEAVMQTCCLVKEM